MSRLKNDVFKASILAVMSAILLGAATYVLSLQIETATRLAAEIDTYTEKGGYGTGTISDFYFFNENVSLFATVKDMESRPVAQTPVTFEIRGPPGTNITLSESTTTNSSGVATATLAAPYPIYPAESVQGIWTAVATIEVLGTQVADSLAFEVKAPPKPFVDVYTDRGGEGPNNFSQPYRIGDPVTLSAKISDGTGPIEGSDVVFAIYWPRNISSLLFLTTQKSNASGIATQTFTIPKIQESIGTWRVMVSVGINELVLIDALTFECKY